MERNITLDYFKLILSVLVITIHLQPLVGDSENLLGWFIYNGVARIAVPCFFIINGYFIAHRISDGKFVKKYVTRLLIIYVVWSIIYFVGFYGEHIKRLLTYCIIGYIHLWYVMALAAGTVILFFLKKWIKNDWILLIIALLLIVTGYFIQRYFFFFIDDQEIKIVTHRNAFFMGFPFIFLGYFIKKMGKGIAKIDTSYLFFVLIASFAALLMESYLFKITHSYCDISFSLMVLCPVLFVIVLRFSRYATNDGYVGKLASGVYFIHLLVIIFMHRILDWENMGGYTIVVLPLIFFLSMLFSASIIEINKRIRVFL